MQNKDAWNPTQYQRFQVERQQPFYDLLALVKPMPNMRVVDLGCGTGELTRKMHEQLGAKATLGIDASAAMLEKASAGAGLAFEQRRIETLAPDESFDLVFSNAALHWLTGHPTLFAKLAGAVVPGGQLAVQVPANHDHVSHEIAAELAAEAPFAHALSGYVRYSPVLAAEDYATLLHTLGFAHQHVQLRVYPHVLPSALSVVEWVKGTLLTAYQSRLDAETFTHFLKTYQSRLLAALGDAKPLFYPFKRILLWAQAKQGVEKHPACDFGDLFPPKSGGPGGLCPTGGDAKRRPSIVLAGCFGSIISFFNSLLVRTAASRRCAAARMRYTRQHVIRYR